MDKKIDLNAIAQTIKPQIRDDFFDKLDNLKYEIKTSGYRALTEKEDFDKKEYEIHLDYLEKFTIALIEKAFDKINEK